MRKPKVKTGYNTPAVCHDHFDGSGHCVECKGRCQLVGMEMAYTALVRMTLEFPDSQIPYGFTRQLKAAGIDVDNLLKRAKETHRRIEAFLNSDPQEKSK